MAPPQVSFVATSRNDGHGGDLLGRMQRFVDGLDAQCRRHDLTAELVLVEWNPPVDHSSLVDVLSWPESGGSLSVRLVTVPPAFHDRLDHSDSMPLYQMIAKNVGIRRARGAFVAATNIDILFSDKVMDALAHNLRPGMLYRADRHDVEPHPGLGEPIDHVLAICRENTVRINRSDGTLLVKEGVFLRIYQSFHEVLMVWIMRQTYRIIDRLVFRLIVRLVHLTRKLKTGFLDRSVRRLTGAVPRRFVRACKLMTRSPSRIYRLASAFLHRNGASRRTKRRPTSQRFEVVLRKAKYIGRKLELAGLAVLAAPRFAWRELRQAWNDTHALPHLHTNGCGDMTLMSAYDWAYLRGYPEWPIFSWHLDSALLHQASASGIRIVELPRDAPVYHLEHSKGSGFTPDGESLLFDRLSHAKTPYLSSQEFSVLAIDLHRRARRGEDVAWDQPDWGMAGISLAEVTPTRGSWDIKEEEETNSTVEAR